MPSPHAPGLEQLRTLLYRAQEQTEREEYAEARATLTNVRGRCLGLGVHSAHLSWSLAVACDGLGDHEAALHHAREAVRMDPLALPYQRSLQLIATHLAAELARPDRAPDAADTPRLYELLLQLNEADAESHLAMARWHLHHDDALPALTLLEALAKLEPWRLAVWDLLGEAARRAGRPDRALEADREAMARRSANDGLSGVTPSYGPRGRWPRG